MEDLKTLIGFDQAISTILSLLWVALLVVVIKHAPSLLRQLIDAWQEMARVLEHQNQVIEQNTKILEGTRKVHEDLDDKTDDVLAILRELQTHSAQKHVRDEEEREWQKEQMRLLKKLYRHVTDMDYVETYHGRPPTEER